jgi:hypothetical protein
MRSRLVVVVEIRGKDSAQRSVVEHDHMVEKLAPDRANHPFYICALPGEARRRKNFGNPHVLYLFPELLPEDRVAVSQQVPREVFERKRVPQLLASPLGGWVCSHVEVNNATPIMRQY